MTKFLTSALVALSMTATAAMAQDWTLDTDTSRMAFATLEFLGEEVDVFTEVFVVRTSARDVMVTTNDMVMLATDELGIDASIDKLQELASLDSITRVTPVTVRFMFSR